MTARRQSGSNPAGSVRISVVGGRQSWTLLIDANGDAKKQLTITGSPGKQVTYQVSYLGDERFEPSFSGTVAVTVIR